MKKWAIIVLSTWFFSSPAFGAEIVYFKNGLRIVTQGTWEDGNKLMTFQKGDIIGYKKSDVDRVEIVENNRDEIEAPAPEKEEPTDAGKPKAKGKYGKIHSAALGNRPEEIAAIADKNPSVLMDKDELEHTPLHIAATYGKEAAVKKILSYVNVDVDARNYEGHTPLYRAAHFSTASIFKLLLDHGADPMAVTQTGETIMHAAAMSIQEDSTEIAKILAEAVAAAHKKDPVNYPESLFDARCHVGRTPLHLAARHNNAGVAALLLDNGADIAVRDGQGRTALHWAAANGKYKAMTVLLDRNIPVNITDKSKKTALHVAVLCSRTESVRMILERAAYEPITDSQGRTPLMIARSFKNARNEDIINLLVQAGATR